MEVKGKGKKTTDFKDQYIRPRLPLSKIEANWEWFQDCNPSLPCLIGMHLIQIKEKRKG